MIFKKLKRVLTFLLMQTNYSNSPGSKRPTMLLLELAVRLELPDAGKNCDRNIADRLTTLIN